jgi:hypothetical protein
MYLRSFVIGSSVLVFLPFFLVINDHILPLYKYISVLDPAKRNYTFNSYAMMSPIFLGIANMISLYFSIQYGWSNAARYFWTSITVPKIIILYVYFANMYKFNNMDWFIYSCMLFTGHFIMWNLVVSYLERNV